MKYAKSRLIGILLILLALIIGLTGLFAHSADRDGSPLSAAYAGALNESDVLDTLEAAITSASDALERTTKRASDAISESESCISAAEDALAVEEAGSYDAETDVGALGQSILDAQAAGEDVSAILENYSPVYNSELIITLDDTKTTVKRAESANEDAAASLQTLIEAALAVDADAVFAEIPSLEEANVPKLGDLTGAQRLLTRANNYLTRGEAAQVNAAALNEAGASILSSAREVLSSHSVTFGSRLVVFCHSRSIDLMTVGGLLLVIGLILILAPAWLKQRWKVPLFRKGFWFILVVALLAAALHYANGDMWDLMREGVFDTLYMTIPATFFSYVLGLPLGVLLVITAPGHIRPNVTLNNAVGTIVNFLRSIPFIILLVMLFDVTRFVMGSAIGTRAIIFPLFVSAFPYVARIVEGSINEVDRGVIEAAQSMGSTTWQIIRKVLITEAMPSLINGAAICMTTILSYTAMAGSAGGDGLGKIAITYGLNYREYDIMYVSSLLLVALVQIIQIAGNILMRAFDHRRRT